MRARFYQNEMARAVRELGYDVRQVRQNGEITDFEIEGVSDSLCERFSKRRGGNRARNRKVRKEAVAKAHGEGDRPDYPGDKAGRLKGDCHV
jgi:conjugative relaxase-like TrwC/TraI family protein